MIILKFIQIKMAKKSIILLKQPNQTTLSIMHQGTPTSTKNKKAAFKRPFYI